MLALTVNHVDEEEKFKAKYLDTYGVKTPCVSVDGGSLLFDTLLDPFFSGGSFLIKPDRTFWSSYSKVENYHTGLGLHNNAIGGTLNEMGITPHQHNDGPLFQFTVTNGTGSGTYKEGEAFVVVAKDSVGYEFVVWTGDTTLLQSTTSETTTVRMGNFDAAITATYKKEETPIKSFSKVADNVSYIVKEQELSITIPHQEVVQIELFNACGRLIYSYGEKRLTAGKNSITIPQKLSSGVAILSIRGSSFSLNKQLYIP